MSVEGNDGLTGEVVSFKEGIDNHREVAPPDGIAEVDGVVAGEVDIALIGWAGVLLLFLSGEVDTFHVAFWVFGGWLDLEFVSAGLFDDFLGE